MITDEVTDRYANKDILLLCVRYVNLLQEKPTIQETFLDSAHVQGRSTGAIIGNHILNILLKDKIDLDHCRAQVYDGKVQWLAKVKERRLLLKDNSHKLSHCINLAVIFACKNKVIQTCRQK